MYRIVAATAHQDRDLMPLRLSVTDLHTVFFASHLAIGILTGEFATTPQNMTDYQAKGSDQLTRWVNPETGNVKKQVLIDDLKYAEIDKYAPNFFEKMCSVRSLGITDLTEEMALVASGCSAVHPTKADVVFTNWALPMLLIGFNADRIRVRENPLYSQIRTQIQNNEWDGLFNIVRDIFPQNRKNMLFLCHAICLVVEADPPWNSTSLAKYWVLRKERGPISADEIKIAGMALHHSKIVLSNTSVFELWKELILSSDISEYNRRALYSHWYSNQSSQTLTSRQYQYHTPELASQLGVAASKEDINRFFMDKCIYIHSLATNTTAGWMHGLNQAYSLNVGLQDFPQPYQLPSFVIPFDDYLRDYPHMNASRSGMRCSTTEAIKKYLHIITIPSLRTALMSGRYSEIPHVIDAIPSSSDKSIGLIVKKLKSTFWIYLPKDKTSVYLDRQSVVSVILQRRQLSAESELKKKQESESKTNRKISKSFVADHDSRITDVIMVNPKVTRKSIKVSKKDDVDNEKILAPAPSSSAPAPNAALLLEPLNAGELKFLKRVVSTSRSEVLLKTEIPKLQTVLSKMGFSCSYQEGKGSHSRFQVSMDAAPEVSVADLMDQTNWFRIESDNVCLSNTLSAHEIPWYQRVRFKDLLSLYLISDASLDAALEKVPGYHA